MVIDVLTLFPEMFTGPLDKSIIGKARERGLVDIHFRNIRAYAEGKHKITDDRPYGGGPGMLMKPEPIYKAVGALRKKKSLVVMMTPDGEMFSQRIARELSGEKHLIFLCGHYEGFDERVRALADREISIGDYVMTNGALAAMVVIDTVARLIPGVVGAAESVEQESFSDGMLDWPQYTRPPVFGGRKVPEVLLSGHHEKILVWRREQALAKTRRRRKDLLPAEEKKTKQTESKQKRRRT
jgi:tRNA (guanine37-N1)-methyltransferase